MATNPSTIAVLKAAIEKNPLALKEALVSALQERIVIALDEMRSSIFEANDEDDEDDSEDDSEDDDKEEVDEETIQRIMSSIIEAATKEGIELSEDELVEMTTAVLDEAWKTKVAVKDGKVDKSGLDANSKYRIRYRGPRPGAGKDARKATATHAIAYKQ